MKNTKGFTLIEILMVIFVLALLGTAAISSYINSTGIFNFLNQYQQVVAVMRTARSYALTNKQVGNPAVAGDYILPDRYGVYIKDDQAGKVTQVTLFADTGSVPSVYDAGDLVVGSKDVKLDSSTYRIFGANSSGDYAAATPTLTLPVAVFYTVGTGDVQIFQNAGESGDVGVGKNVLVKRSADKCISLKLKETGSTREKYIVIFQVSGLAEEYDKLTVCKVEA